jgi:hypothetical protein
MSLWLVSITHSQEYQLGDGDGECLSIVSGVPEGMLVALIAGSSRASFRHLASLAFVALSVTFARLSFAASPKLSNLPW